MIITSRIDKVLINIKFDSVKAIINGTTIEKILFEWDHSPQKKALSKENKELSQKFTDFAYNAYNRTFSFFWYCIVVYYKLTNDDIWRLSVSGNNVIDQHYVSAYGYLANYNKKEVGKTLIITAFVQKLEVNEDCVILNQYVSRDPCFPNTTNIPGCGIINIHLMNYEFKYQTCHSHKQNDSRFEWRLCDKSTRYGHWRIKEAFLFTAVSYCEPNSARAIKQINDTEQGLLKLYSWLAQKPGPETYETMSIEDYLSKYLALHGRYPINLMYFLNRINEFKEMGNWKSCYVIETNLTWRKEIAYFMATQVVKMGGIYEECNLINNLYFPDERIEQLNQEFNLWYRCINISIFVTTNYLTYSLAFIEEECYP